MDSISQEKHPVPSVNGEVNLSEIICSKIFIEANSVPGTVLGTRNTAKNTISGPARELPGRGVRRKAPWMDTLLGGWMDNK